MRNFNRLVALIVFGQMIYGCAAVADKRSLFDGDEPVLQLISEVFPNSDAPTERRISVFESLKYNRYFYETSEDVYNVGIGRDANGQVRNIDMVFHATDGACTQFSYLDFANELVDRTEPAIDQIEKRKQALANNLAFLWEKENSPGSMPGTVFAETVYQPYNSRRTCMIKIFKLQPEGRSWPKVLVPKCKEQPYEVCPEVIEKL